MIEFDGELKWVVVGQYGVALAIHGPYDTIEEAMEWALTLYEETTEFPYSQATYSVEFISKPVITNTEMPHGC